MAEEANLVEETVVASQGLVKEGERTKSGRKRRQPGRFEVMARIVGKRWKELPSEDRAKYEAEAEVEMKKYRASVAEYNAELARRRTEMKEKKAEESKRREEENRLQQQMSVPTSRQALSLALTGNHRSSSQQLPGSTAAGNLNNLSLLLQPGLAQAQSQRYQPFDLAQGSNGPQFSLPSTQLLLHQLRDQQLREQLVQQQLTQSHLSSLLAAQPDQLLRQLQQRQAHLQAMQLYPTLNLQDSSQLQLQLLQLQNLQQQPGLNIQQNMNNDSERSPQLPPSHKSPKNDNGP